MNYMSQTLSLQTIFKYSHFQITTSKIITATTSKAQRKINSMISVMIRSRIFPKTIY